MATTHVIEKDWTSEAGLRCVCLIIRGSHRSGYVEVSKDSPFFGKGYSEPLNIPSVREAADSAKIGKKGAIIALSAVSVDDQDGYKVRSSLDVAIDCHGGLTYSGHEDRDYPVKSDGWWFGFDCAHYGDGRIDEPGSVLGASSEATSTASQFPARSLEFVVQECESIAKQLIALEQAVSESSGELPETRV